MSDIYCINCHSPYFRTVLGEDDEFCVYATCIVCGVVRALNCAPPYYSDLGQQWPKLSDECSAYLAGTGASGL
jgi:hypothetical protein